MRHLNYSLLLIDDGYFRTNAMRADNIRVISGKKIILVSKCTFVVRGTVIKLRCSATSYAYSEGRKIYTQ